MHYVPLRKPKELPRHFVEPLWGVTQPHASTYTEKQNAAIRMCIQMRCAGFEQAIPVDSVNIFAVYYSHNTRAACHNLSATTKQPPANKYTAGHSASVPWYRLFTR
jgi:hypothetical protein